MRNFDQIRRAINMKTPECDIVCLPPRMWKSIPYLLISVSVYSASEREINHPKII